MAWIKLQIHPEHDKVLAIADLTGASPERCFAAAVRWFRWADEHAEDASIGLSRRAFREVTRWKGDGLAEAMLHDRVDWLTEAGGVLSPTRWETHMSQGAKVRAETAKRVSKAREYGKCNANSVTKVTVSALQKAYLEQEKEKEEDRDTASAVAAAAAAAAAARADEADETPEGPDPRIVALTGIGMPMGTAYGLICRHKPPLDAVENYVSRAMEPGVNNRASFCAAAIREAWPIQAAPGADGRVVNRVTQQANAQAERLVKRIAARSQA